MKKKVVLISIFSIIQLILIMVIRGVSYPLLPLFILLPVLTYMSIEDWETGLISIGLNILVLILSIVYSIFIGMNIKTIGINLLIFVLPFILLEAIFQLFINKDEERFLIGGGDIILFASMSFIFNLSGMVIMLFTACFLSLIVSKIIKKSLVHFAPFIQMGFLVAFLFGDKLLEIWNNFNSNLLL